MNALAHAFAPARLPLVAALAFLSAFVVLPLGGLAAATVFGPDGFTLEAWTALAADKNAITQLIASLQLGLAHYAVEPGAGLAKAMELAGAIATNSPVSNYAVINGVTRIAEMGHSEGLYAEMSTASLTGADAEQRITKIFQQRRESAAVK